MFELFRDLNWSLIGMLVVGGGVVAWVGDKVGMRLGKKRVKIFNLRPKKTATFITVCTGVGIALVSLLLMSLSSQQVRTALFSMNYVQSQITALMGELQQNRDDLRRMEVELFQSRGELDEKQKELQTVGEQLDDGNRQLADAKNRLARMKRLRDIAQKEQKALVSENSRLREERESLVGSVESLRSEAKDLRANLQRMREGRIAILTDEVLAQGIITDKSLSAEQIDNAVKRLTAQSRSMMAYRMGKRPEDVAQVEVDGKSITETKNKLLNADSGRYLMRLSAATNAVEGETVRAYLECFKTVLVFKSGEVLSQRDFSSGIAQEVVEDSLLRMLREINTHAYNSGVMRDPISGDVGAIDTTEFMDAVEEIVESKGESIVKVVAAEDIYTEGPVRVKFEIVHSS